MRDGKPQIVIYAYTPVDYEFATDFSTIKSNAITTAGKIREYVQKNFLNVQNETALLIVNGVILGTLVVSDILAKS